MLLQEVFGNLITEDEETYSGNSFFTLFIINSLALLYSIDSILWKLLKFSKHNPTTLKRKSQFSRHNKKSSLPLLLYKLG